MPGVVSHAVSVDSPDGRCLDDVDICRTVMNQVLSEWDRSQFSDRASYRRSFRFPIREFYADAGITDDEFVPAADEVLSIADAHTASKAEVIAEWIGRIGVDPQEVLLVGDTNHDREIAEALGTQFVHCSFGHQDLSGESGLATIETLSEVLALV